jgi:predicted small integral membrane protein
MMQDLAATFEWMAWTRPTAIFLLLLVAMLALMTVLGIRYPAVARKGFLPMATTRGDRLYIGLLGVALIHLAWLGATELALGWASLIAALWLTAVLRWG